MASSSYDNMNDHLVADVYPFFRIYKDGRVERYDDKSASVGFTYVPPSPQNSVSSKDVSISSHVSARLYLPKNTTQKLPILVYYHGGALVLGSPFSHLFHRYLNILVAESNAVAISVEYRLAPEHDVPTIYEDCWTALRWVASHVDDDERSIIGNNKDSWLTHHGDFDKLFIVGDSAGGNIVYNMIMRAGIEGGVNENVNIYGSIIAFPFLLIPIENIEQVVSYKLWMALVPASEDGINSPMINPLAPCLSKLGCSRMLLCFAEKDEYVPREIGIQFVEGVKKSGWKGDLEFIEVENEGHCFQLANPETKISQNLIKRFASFIQHK